MNAQAFGDRYRKAGGTGSREPALFGLEPGHTREPARATPDFAAIHQQRQTERFVTRQLLWQEYRDAYPTAMQH